MDIVCQFKKLDVSLRNYGNVKCIVDIQRRIIYYVFVQKGLV